MAAAQAPSAAAALTRIRALIPADWSSLKLAGLRKTLTPDFTTDAIESAIEAMIRDGAVKTPDGRTLYPSEKSLAKAVKSDEVQKLRADASKKRKALRKAIKETPKIERRFLYAGVLPTAIADDPGLSVYAKMAAVVIDDRLNNFPKHRRRNRTIGFGELAAKMGRGVGKASAFDAVQELIDARHLYVDEKGGGRRGNLYAFEGDIETYGRESADSSS